ncbi:hypothetical protein [Rufibacter sp. LB8]|nr:hypothetical protein [Rufibacter sp. LB8]
MENKYTHKPHTSSALLLIILKIVKVCNRPATLASNSISIK